MVVKKIKALLRKSNKAKVDRVKKLVDQILKHDPLDRAKHSKQLSHCLDAMEEQATRIRAQANDYPSYSLKADSWIEGVALSNYAEVLARFLSDKDFLPEQDRATKLWAQTTLSVSSRDHHLIGPAMIAAAAISERTGQLDYAEAVYSAVLDDFQPLLEEAEMEDTELDQDTLIALQSLRTAATTLVKPDTATQANPLAMETLRRIDALVVR